MDQADRLQWIDDKTLEFEGLRFLVSFDPKDRVASTVDRFLLVKGNDQLREYLGLGAKLKPERVVELGIFQGGSTVFFEKAFRPAKIVAFDLDVPVPALDAYVIQHRLGDRMSVNYGVNQTDRKRIWQVLEEAFSGRPIDLVVDDASHLLRETRTSFNFLFPRVRPGGAYVIEDWGWEHWRPMWQKFAGAPPLTNLVFELVMTAASRPDIVSRLSIMPSMVIVHRGDAKLGDDFEISKSYVVRDARDFASLFDADDDAAFALARRMQRVLDGNPSVARALKRASRLVRGI